MKVLLFPATNKPWDGIEVYSYELARRLCKRGVEVDGIRIGIKKKVTKVEDCFTLYDIPTPNLKGNGYIIRMLIAVFRSKEIFKRSDVIHAIGGSYGAIAFFPGKKVVTIIGASSLREKSYLRKKIRETYGRFLYKGASAYIVPNTIIKEEVETGFGIRNSTIIPIGIDVDGLKVDENKADIRRRFGIPEEDIVVLYLGQLVKGKRIRELVESFSLALKVQNRLRLVLVAWGYLRKEIEELVRTLNIGNRVTFVNPVPYDQRKYVFSMADLFVMIGDSFGDGGVSSAIMDALGSGLPIIGARGSPNSLVIKDGENGYLVNPTNREEISKAILSAIENKEKLGKKALDSSKEYDWEKVVDMIINVYKRVIYD
ncbi:glycosyltransferase family 4 protein [Acidianus sp. RZ1]|uniref:glycosyltransferase family 4 protein n=1 Tax=Acidianus sp. RZ1 TaxID=1540082 RepID=UPI001490E81D|nr:glycosyltransferase family 4 protein [Acidianus sp. RZ1]NON63045.1 glycosyltransferase family 4 protein [Acidianus sp. RZ1]